MFHMGKETETWRASPPPVDIRAIEEMLEQKELRVSRNETGGVPGEIRSQLLPNSREPRAQGPHHLMCSRCLPQASLVSCLSNPRSPEPQGDGIQPTCSVPPQRAPCNEAQSTFQTNNVGSKSVELL